MLPPPWKIHTLGEKKCKHGKSQHGVSPSFHIAVEAERSIASSHGIYRKESRSCSVRAMVERPLRRLPR
jgi:hypothetical protein